MDRQAFPSNPGMKTCSCLSGLISLALALAPAAAQTPGAVETFSWLSNADSWTVYDWGEGEFYFPEWDLDSEDSDLEIYFTVAGNSLLDIYARAGSSGGAFTGDLAAAGVDAVGCEVYLEDGAAFQFGEIFFSTGPDLYFSELFPAETGWSFAYASFSEGVWYDEAYQPVSLDPAILSEVTEIGVTFYPREDGSADGLKVAIDNFTFYARLAPPRLSATRVAGGLRLEFQRAAGLAYTIRGASALDQALWPPLPGQIDINGTTPYSYVAPITGVAGFFKVEAMDFLTPVPQVGG
jgi:hypothetical protein